MSLSFFTALLKEIKLLVWRILTVSCWVTATKHWSGNSRSHSLFSFLSFWQVFPWRLPHRRLYKRLPGRLLPTLWGLSAWGEDRALCPLHGELWWLQHLRWHSQRLQALGVQQATLAQRAAQVLWEVPALYTLLSRLWVSARTRILLYMWVNCCFTLWLDLKVPLKVNFFKRLNAQFE